jgi:hypothetical protein
MKRSLVTVVIVLATSISGCNTTPAPRQGKPGQAGQQDPHGDQGQAGQQDKQGPSAQCPPGQKRYTDPATGNSMCATPK